MCLVLALCGCGERLVPGPRGEGGEVGGPGETEAGTTVADEETGPPDPDADGTQSDGSPFPDFWDGAAETGTDPGGDGDPGGAGPGATPDDEGDVTNPSADVVAAAVYLSGDLVDFRAQFAAPPFDHSATHRVDWCIDLDGFKTGAGSCGTHGEGVDVYVSAYAQLDGNVGEFGLSVEHWDGGSEQPDPCQFAAYEPETRTLRVLLLRSQIGGVGPFDTILISDFGGSGGANEWVPDAGWGSVVEVDELPPFAGAPACG
jgi:hypothetical protein